MTGSSVSKLAARKLGRQAGVWAGGHWPGQADRWADWGRQVGTGCPKKRPTLVFVEFFW